MPKWPRSGFRPGRSRSGFDEQLPGATPLSNGPSLKLMGDLR